MGESIGWEHKNANKITNLSFYKTKLLYSDTKGSKYALPI